LCPALAGAAVRIGTARRVGSTGRVGATGWVAVSLGDGEGRYLPTIVGDVIGFAL
jgi:hypothetical protein